MLWINALLLEQETCYILCFRQDSTENVNWLNGLLTTALCTVDGFLNRLLCLDCKLFEIHSYLLLYFILFQFSVFQFFKYNIFAKHIRYAIMAL